MNTARIIERICDYELNIFLELPEALNGKYVSIIEQFSMLVEQQYGNQLNELKEQMITHAFDIMMTGDFIRMSECLSYEIKPILEEISSMR